ncbi:MAG: hypothetical protein ACLU38_13280 [Dysosmobacter sp.]
MLAGRLEIFPMLLLFVPLHLAGEPSAALGTAKLNIVNQPGAALPLPVEIVDKVVNSP